MFIAGNILGLLITIVPRWIMRSNLYVGYKKRWDKFDKEVAKEKLGYLCMHVWPTDPSVQLNMLLCFLLMIFSRILKFVIPMFGKMIVDELTGKKNFMFDMISMSFGYLCLQGGTYVDTILQDFHDKLIISVVEHRMLKVEVELYERAVHMPYKLFIDNKFNWDAYGYMTLDSIKQFPDYIVFELIPVLVDLATAFYIFSGSIDVYYLCVMGFIAFVEMNLSTWVSKICPPWYERRNSDSDDDFEVDSDDEIPCLRIGSTQEFEAIKYFCNEKEEVQKHMIDKKNDYAYDKKEMSGFHDIVQDGLRDAVMMVGSFLMAYQRSSTETAMTAGDYILFSHYLSRFTTPLNTIKSIHSRIEGYLDNMDRVYDLFHDPTEIPTGEEEEVEIAGGIRLQNVSFSYDGEANPVLSDVSFDVLEGQTVALVGLSGSGKSTIIRLLYRFLDPTEGSITINNVDLQKLNIHNYRKAVSIVPQECSLLYTSVRNNIAYGRLTATDEEIDKAAQIAQISKLLQRDDASVKKKREEKKWRKKQKRIRKMFGYDKNYTDDEEEEEDKERVDVWKMSGGERQRVAIARAVLKDPKYLFLDEATSSLDTITEREIQQALMDATKGKTCVVVAHRLSTIAHADNIIVLKEGKVVEQGNHSELLDKRGLYSKMWYLQQGGDLNCLNLNESG